jgi:hypothetical protein
MFLSAHKKRECASLGGPVGARRAGYETEGSGVCPFLYTSSPWRSSRDTLRALAGVGSIPVLVHLLYQPCTVQFGGLVLDHTEGTAGLEVSGLMWSKTSLALACTRSMYAW